MDFRQKRKFQQLKHNIANVSISKSSINEASISKASINEANINEANINEANINEANINEVSAKEETIYLNINNDQNDTPFLIIGNSSFNENFIHIRENNTNNTNYQAIYGYFSKYNENNSSDVYKLQLYNSNNSLLFSSEYGISLSSDTPTFKGCLFTTMKINNNNNTIPITKNANVIVR